MVSSAELVARYEWGYAGTRSYMGQPVTTTTTTPSGAAVAVPVTRHYDPPPSAPSAPAAPTPPTPTDPFTAVAAGQDIQGKFYNPYTKKWEYRPDVTVVSVTPAGEPTRRPVDMATVPTTTPSPFTVTGRGQQTAGAPTTPKPSPEDELAIGKRVEMLQRMRQENVAGYLAVKFGSAAGTGAVTGMVSETGATAGLALSTQLGIITREEAAEREYRRIAKRSLQLEQAPAQSMGMAFVQDASLVVGSSLLGRVGTKLAYSKPVLGQVWARGWQVGSGALVTAHLAPAVASKDLERIGGSLGQVVGAGVLGYYGYREGVRFEVREQYLKGLKAVRFGEVSLKEVRQELKVAEAGGRLRPDQLRPVSKVFKEIEIMQRYDGKVGRVTQEILTEYPKRAVLGGSASTRVHTVLGKVPADVDIYPEDVAAFTKFALSKYRKAGIPVRRMPRSRSLGLGGQKLMDITPLKSGLEAKGFYTGTRTTPEGIEVMQVETQFFRKVLGKYEQPRVKGRVIKDIPDFERMVTSVIRTGKVKAAESPPVIKQYREYKVARLQDMFKIGKRGYAYPQADVPKPTVIIPPFIDYKPSKRPKPPKQYSLIPKARDPYSVAPPTPRYQAPTRFAPTGYPTTFPKYPTSIIDTPYTPTKYPTPDTTPPIIVMPPYDRPPKRPPRREPEIEIDHFGPKKRKYQKPMKPRRMFQRKYQYTPTVVGISTGRTIRRAPRSVGIGSVGIRYPVERRTGIDSFIIDKLSGKPKKRKKDEFGRMFKRFGKDFGRTLGL